MHPSLLVVGHDAPRLAATRDSLRRGGLLNPVHACRDAHDLASYVDARPPYQDRAAHPLPAAIVTELRLRRGDALDVLRFVRGHLAVRGTPVVVTAQDANDAEISSAHHLGAAAFLSHDVALEVLVQVIRDSGAPWALGREDLST